VWTIREGLDGDAERLSGLARATFRAAFGPFNAPEDMDLHCASHFTPEAQEAELRDPGMRTLILEGPPEGSGGVEGSGDRAPWIGYAQLRRGPAPPCVRGGSPIELQRFYVVPDLHGRGVAGELMDAVVAAAAAGGADTLWLGVWERNPRAIRFYAKAGFREVGDQTFVLGRDPQRDLVMVRSI